MDGEWRKKRVKKNKWKTKAWNEGGIAAGEEAWTHHMAVVNDPDVTFTSKSTWHPQLFNSLDDETN